MSAKSPVEHPLSKSDAQILTNRGYIIENIVGEGSYAKVYQCKKVDNGKTHWLACKVIDAAKAPANFAKKFLAREIDILTKISHPHIIHLYSMLHKGNKFFIFMRLAEKGDLLEYILKKNQVGEGRARSWTAQLALALEYLHEMGIVHRDIKTENILITASFNAKLSDFGFARNIYQNGVENLCQTHCGSMPYTAPEVLRGRKYDARKSDMWSLGVVTYVMLNRRLPFTGSTNQEAMIQRQLEKRVSFDTKEAHTSHYRSAVMSLLEPDVGKRLSASQLLSSPWIMQDDRLILRTKQEKEALAKARIIKEKSMVQHKPVEEEENIVALHRSLMEQAATAAMQMRAGQNAAGVSVLRPEAISSYTSIRRDVDHLEDATSGVRVVRKPQQISSSRMKK
ncbi:testis-specific serine/threonine-protein kinase 3-like [Cimex lectularius]|uniref:Protein kinase domain-containing protein n=1 Tax=Cimex lectularius TaxID=79782 RepID=A0A8I6SV39_CIMLE|nr:testis-specific serine/threonine-protein kinase 3-like [Cimex lectularius]XP_014248484.1 testis-specific serine/threonine-protein kinase 3-like [Cimex lectularius]XP_024085461.1 testis-specific serine/threonine-protein kinase 3-like [Cimex lectularius]